MLDDIPLVKQLVELIFYVLITLNFYTQVCFLFFNSFSSLNICSTFTYNLTLGFCVSFKVHQPSTPIMLLHSTIVGSSLLLFDKFVSPQASEVANVIVGHPKVSFLFAPLKF